MNEKQLKKMDSQEDVVLQEGDDNFQEEDSKIEIAEWIMFGLALGFIAAVMGFFFWNKQYEKQKEISNLQLQADNIKNN